MVLKNKSDIKKWLWICLIPLIGGFSAVCAVSLTVNGRLDENSDDNRFRIFPVAVLVISAAAVITIFILAGLTEMWQLIIALAIVLYISGYLNLLYAMKVLSKKEKAAETEVITQKREAQSKDGSAEERNDIR